MGNQSSILADMVYRVFPNLEPNQHQLLDQGPSIQSLFSPRTAPTPKSPYGRSNSIGGGFAGPPTSFGRQHSPTGSQLSPTSSTGPYDVQPFGRSLTLGMNGVSAATMRMAAELAAMAAQRACTQPKPMAMASFEVAALSLRVLDLWDRLSKENIRLLRRSFKEVSGPEMFLFGSFDLRWRIVGVELRKELGLLTASIASIAERCDPALVDEIQMHCWNVSRKRRRSSLFEQEEENMLMTALENMASVTGTLRDEMEALDNLMPSNHPLRNPEGNDGDPFSGKKGNPNSPKPTPQANQARRQQLVKAQLATVQQLQRESLWNQDFDWTVLLLCVALAVLWHKFRDTFGRPKVEDEELSQTLGSEGLSLHYANIILLLDNLVQRPNIITNTGARDEVYQKLPVNVKSGLRTRLRHWRQPLDADLVLELRRTVTHFLSWMVPLAESTLAWESERSFSGVMARRPRKHLGETLYFADRDQFELLLIELLVALTHTLGPRQKSRQAVLAQAELLGHTRDDEADVKLPPVPHATLPRMERRNGELPSPRGPAKPGTPRALTPIPIRGPRKVTKTDKEDGEGEERGREGEGEVREDGDARREGEQQPAPQMPSDLYGAPANGHDSADEDGEHSNPQKEQQQGPPGGGSAPGKRVRRPAPRPPPGFGGNQTHRMMHDFRPTLMG